MRRKRRRRGVARHRPAGRVPTASPRPRRREIGRPSDLRCKSESSSGVRPPPLSAHRPRAKRAPQMCRAPQDRARARGERSGYVWTFWLTRGRQRLLARTRLTDHARKRQPRNMRTTRRSEGTSVWKPVFAGRPPSRVWRCRRRGLRHVRLDCPADKQCLTRVICPRRRRRASPFVD